MSPLAYVIKSWREIRLVIFIVLTVLALLSSFLVQESIRWLISLSKIKRCNKIVDRVAKFNQLCDTGRKTRKVSFKTKYEKKRERLRTMLKELEVFNKIQAEQEAKSNHNPTLETGSPGGVDTMPNLNRKVTNSIRDLFRNSKFRLYVLIMALNWFATALVYDGLTYLNNYIGENIFFNWIAMNLIELPAQFVCYYIISRYGRRMTVSVTLVLAGVTLLCTVGAELVPALESVHWLKLVLFVLAKFIVTQSYSAVILHAPELFPTNLRSFGYGLCLFSGKVTSVLSPMISLYISKIMPLLPAIIYGCLSVVCGLVSLYVPETLNRPLPNSIDDVIKWPRSLSKNEWKEVKKLNDEEIKQVLKCFTRRAKAASTSRNEEILKYTTTSSSTSASSLSVDLSFVGKCVYENKLATTTTMTTNTSGSQTTNDTLSKSPSSSLSTTAQMKSTAGVVFI